MPQQECRRAGLCLAEDVGDPPCQSLWTGPLSHQFEDMAAGIELSAWCTERRQARTYAWLVQMLDLPEVARPRRKKRPSTRRP